MTNSRKSWNALPLLAIASLYVLQFLGLGQLRESSRKKWPTANIFIYVAGERKRGRRMVTMPACVAADDATLPLVDVLVRWMADKTGRERAFFSTVARSSLESWKCGNEEARTARGSRGAVRA